VNRHQLRNDQWNQEIAMMLSTRFARCSLSPILRPDQLSPARILPSPARILPSPARMLPSPLQGAAQPSPMRRSGGRRASLILRSPQNIFFTKDIDVTAKIFNSFHEAKRFVGVNSSSEKKKKFCKRCPQENFRTTALLCEHISREHLGKPIEYVQFVRTVVKKFMRWDGNDVGHYFCHFCQFSCKSATKGNDEKARKHWMAEFNFGKDKKPRKEKVQTILAMMPPEEYFRLCRQSAHERKKHQQELEDRGE
jgi:hypothetical protein